MKKQYMYGKNKQCPICMNYFQARDADSKSYTSKYCSHACNNKARTKHKEKPCLQCGEIFKPIRSTNNFCSKKCAGNHKAENHDTSIDVIINKKMASFCCGAIHRCLRNKTDRTKVMLGYTSKELRSHLEKYFQQNMSWENYGKGVNQWSIDHTRPISSFPITASLSEINSLENLRPMWHAENCSKKNKWEGQ